MSDRLSQKEIKQDIREDATAVFITRMADAVIEHKQKLIAAGIGVVVLLIAGFVWSQMRAASVAKANVRLAEAMEAFAAPIAEDDVTAGDGPTFADEATKQAEVEKAFAAVGAGGAGHVAGLYLADLALEQGDTAKARELWQSFVDAHGDNLISQSARINLISLDRQEGRGEEVVATLEKELSKSTPALPKDVVLWELAKTLELLDRDDDAKTYYQRILDEHAASPFASEARQKAGADATDLAVVTPS